MRRGLSTFETSIVRTAEDRMVKVSAEQTMLGELLKAVHGTHAEEKVREVMRQAEALEGSRLKHEAELAVKLWDAVRGVEGAWYPVWGLGVVVVAFFTHALRRGRRAPS